MSSNGLSTYPKNILKMSPQEKTEFLDSFDIVLSDCDGVVWKALPREPIEGVSQGIEFLKSRGKQVAFVTNNSIRPIEEHLKRLHDYGIPAKVEDVNHPAQNVVEYLQQIKFKGLIYCLACTAFKNHLRNAGFDLFDGPSLIAENLSDLAGKLADNLPVKAVVMDVDFNMSAVKIMKAHLYIQKDPECLLIGGAADPMLPFGRYEIVGNGPFINMVENAAKIKAKILGKPGLELTTFLMSKYKVEDPTRVLFVGDSLCSDVQFGKLSGFQTLAVLTGSAKLEDFDHCESNLRPDFYMNGLADFKDFL